MQKNFDMQEQIAVKEEIDIEKLTKCLNCGTEFKGKFCPNCGQKADTDRFTVSFIFRNFIQGILSNDGGIWFTLKNLLTRPGQMMVDIINGKRKSYFSPFPMLFLTLSLYVVIFTFTGSKKMDFDGLFDDDETVEVKVNDKNLTEKQILAEKTKVFIINSLKFYQRNYTAFFILTIPIYLLSARVSFGKKNRKTYNWGEYCIPIVYSLILLVLYRCLMSIVFYFSPHTSDIMSKFMTVMNVIVYTACFKKMLEFSIVKTAWRSFLTIVFYWVFVISIAILVAVVAILVLIMIHPEYFS